MAKINPVRLKQEAEKLEIAGRPDQAVVLYRQILEENPRDWNVINKIGDIYAKMNRVREAGEEYAKVADFYAKDGFLLKAIAIWKKINKLDASALEPYQNLAELYAKQGLLMEAKSQYQFVVDELIKRGRTREAGEVLKKMGEVDPGDLKIRSKLADLYTREGHSDKAVDEHVAIAEELNKKGHLAEALQVLEKGLKIAPKNHRLLSELGRVHLIQKNFDRASQYLEEATQQSPSDSRLLNRLGEAYLGAKKIEQAEGIFKRLLEVNPGDDEARIQMGRLCLLQERFDRAYEEFLPVVERLVSRHDGDKAALLLQQIVQKNPAHIKSLRKLVDVYQAFKKEAGVLATYSQLTEAYINQGRFDEAASVLEVLVSKEPLNQQHQTKLGFVQSRMAPGERPSMAPAGAPFSEFVEEEFDLGQPEPEAPAPVRPSQRPAAPSPRPRPAIEVSGPLSEDDREFVDEHLAEGRVFRKYGLVDKAADQFEAIVARFPDNVDARQELRDLFKEKADIPKAVEQCLALAEILRLHGDPRAAQVQEEEARRLLPEATELPLGLPRARSKEEVRATAAAGRRLEPPEEEEITLEGEALTFEGAEAGLEDAPLEPFTLEEEETPFGGEFAQHFLDEEAVLTAEEPSPQEKVDAGYTGAAVFAPMDEEVPLGLVLDQDALAGTPAKTAPPVAIGARETGAPEMPPALRRVLDEVDEYVALGFVEDAKEALHEIAARHRGHPALFAKMAELGMDFEGPSVAHVSPAQEAPGLGRLDATFEEPFEELTAAREPPPAREPVPPASPADLLEFDMEGAEIKIDLDSVGFSDEVEPTEVRAEATVPPAQGQIEAPTVSAGTSSSDEEALTLTVELEGEEEGESGLRLEEEPLPLARAAEEEGFDFGLPSEPIEEEPAFVGAIEQEDEAPLVPSERPSVWSPAPGVLDHDEDNPFDVEAVEAQAVDLASELGDLFGTQMAVEEPPPEAAGTELGELGLAEIFKEFKKGVDKQLSQEDYDTRYNLGIAYKEMGLVDEAIAEFQLAAKDPDRLLECSSMLGICFMDKGMPKLAIKWFEKGLKAPGRTEEEYLGLRYDLASAHEAAGDTEIALGIYTELYGQDANFRDVAAKVKELRGAQTSG